MNTKGSVLDDVKAQIESALANHEATKNAMIEVINDSGLVTLQGEVSNLEAGETAEAIARKTSGVHSVTNSLFVRNSEE